MNPVSPTPGRPTRVRIVEATRPHTPRLHSPPQEADAGPGPPGQGGRLRTHNDGQQTIKGITKEIGQHLKGRYSLQPGGLIFDALLAHFSVSVSTTPETQPEQLAEADGWADL